jgi:uncharacterized protein (DUF427 family)
MLTPGPDHPITIVPATKRWRVAFQHHVIGDSGDVLILEEANHGKVAYFPREDVDMAYFSRTDRSTHCPYKGDAAYYTILMDGHFADNAVWTYEDPYPAMEQIRERLAFYPDKVEVYEVEGQIVEPKAQAADVNDVIQHTDAGDGHSQREHWRPSEDPPARP